MAEIIPFPRTRNRRFILKHAGNIAGMSAAQGEKYLANTVLKVQRETMLRRGVGSPVVEQEMRALELAIRAALWRVVMEGGAA
ncbi:DUF6074 family protein [Chelatococcus reniformis]|uniref:Uncharacterized protein n=1 Tax=Chelatococcus reniformis TaxID=1494448 RepID=A0A916UEK4_9HYPH|nr:DUF6074 family protein [Chelatococcus reniformis]GGC70776.1 hypothetical protein GCM10010994_31670 [Chelatococcus reniformis]